MSKIVIINGFLADEEDVKQLNIDIENKIKKRLKMGLEPTMRIKCHCFSNQNNIAMYDVETIGG